jgi:hypothetical protein
MRSTWWGLVDSFEQTRQRLDTWVLGRKHALYAVAACRIGTALSVVGLLIANWSTRNLWVGQASIWAEPARAVSQFPELAVLHNVSSDVLTVVYAVTILAAIALALGWHTKPANVITFVGFIAIVAQNPVVGGQSDNLVRLTLLWLLLMGASERWSLDARRRTGAREGRRKVRVTDEDVLPRWLSTAFHNLALVGLATQTVLVYMAAGLDKVAQHAWQHGTALYYTMQLPEYRPFPWLSDLLSSSQVVLAIVTYTVLMVQLFFAPLLLNPISRRVLLVLAVGVNIIFAVLFAAPWSSLAVIAVTCLFVSTPAWEALDDRVRVVFGPSAAWLADRGGAVLDVGDELRHRFVLPVYDWVRFTIFRR